MRQMRRWVVVKCERCAVRRVCGRALLDYGLIFMRSVRGGQTVGGGRIELRELLRRLLFVSGVGKLQCVRRWDVLESGVGCLFQLLEWYILRVEE